MILDEKNEKHYNNDWDKSIDDSSDLDETSKNYYNNNNWDESIYDNSIYSINNCDNNSSNENTKNNNKNKIIK